MSAVQILDATLFLSTPSARRATMPPPSPYGQGLHFYPRPPRGGRLEDLPEEWTDETFLSTPSARRATRQTQTVEEAQDISIHALREEGDRKGLESL